MFTIETLPELTKIEYTSFVFAGGEVQVRVTNPNSVSATDAIRIDARLTNSNQIFELALLTDAIRRINPFILIHLHCPYLPYARQDRCMVAGESLALKVMCDFINSLNFTSVTIADAHSDVTLALINRINNISQENLLSSFVSQGKLNLQNTILVSPDGGALKKIYKVSKHFNLPVIRADKTRSVIDGSISGTVVYSESVGNSDFLIVDDIADGGKSFIELSKILRPLTTGKIKLYVTHGIFSKGLTVFEKLIDEIYCAYPFSTVDKSNSILIEM